MEHTGKYPPGPASYNDGCRCTECRRLHAIRHGKTRQKLAARGREHPELIPHGTTGGYSNWRCRCPACTTANRLRCAHWRNRATGPAVA